MNNNKTLLRRFNIIVKRKTFLFGIKAGITNRFEFIIEFKRKMFIDEVKKYHEKGVLNDYDTYYNYE